MENELESQSSRPGESTLSRFGLWGLSKLHGAGPEYIESRWGLGKLFNVKQPHNALWRLFNLKPAEKREATPVPVPRDQEYRHEMRRHTPRPGR